MSDFLGIDTSNYTTSVAIYNSESCTVTQEKLLLPVKDGELGIRQSDAVFHHVKNLPILFERLFKIKTSISGIGVSSRPRNIEGSYMPCFLAGESFSKSLGAVENISVDFTSHQVGHILAALYSCGRLDLVNEKFIAFHVSGGTTDCLLVEPDSNEIIKAKQIASSLDLKAGQAVDRVGVMLGLKFPCGKELEQLALKSERTFKIKPTLKNLDCSLSGIENKCKKMFMAGEKKEDIALFCIQYILEAIDEMTKRVIDSCGRLPVVYAGGVMSNTIIKGKLTKKYSGFFSSPEFSCDNAAGVAIFSALKSLRRNI